MLFSLLWYHRRHSHLINIVLGVGGGWILAAIFWHLDSRHVFHVLVQVVCFGIVVIQRLRVQFLPKSGWWCFALPVWQKVSEELHLFMTKLMLYTSFYNSLMTASLKQLVMSRRHHADVLFEQTCSQESSRTLPQLTFRYTARMQNSHNCNVTFEYLLVALSLNSNTWKATWNWKIEASFAVRTISPSTITQYSINTQPNNKYGVACDFYLQARVSGGIVLFGFTQV